MQNLLNKVPGGRTFDRARHKRRICLPAIQIIFGRPFLLLTTRGNTSRVNPRARVRVESLDPHQFGRRLVWACIFTVHFWCRPGPLLGRRKKNPVTVSLSIPRGVGGKNAVFAGMKKARPNVS